MNQTLPLVPLPQLDPKVVSQIEQWTNRLGTRDAALARHWLNTNPTAQYYDTLGCKLDLFTEAFDLIFIQRWLENWFNWDIPTAKVEPMMRWMGQQCLPRCYAYVHRKHQQSKSHATYALAGFEVKQDLWEILWMDYLIQVEEHQQKNDYIPIRYSDFQLVLPVLVERELMTLKR
jgi:hypothetical protein